MKHTFLFKEGLWVVKGEYTGADGDTVNMEGETRTFHARSSWVTEGYVRLLMKDAPVQFDNRYEITPFDKEKNYTTWKSFNPALGAFSGRFVVVEDTLISTFTSKDNEYSGAEILIQISEMHYRSRGFVFKKEERMSSWAADLMSTGHLLH